MIDNTSLLIGIAFSGASLVLALVIGWLNSRAETYLIHGAAGIGLIVAAVAALSLRNGTYSVPYQLVTFAVMLAGFAFVLSGSRLFNKKQSGPSLLLALATIAATSAALLVGLTGLGTMLLNASVALFLLLCGLEFWRSRREGRLAMIANAALYMLVSASFMSCALVLLVDGAWVLDGPPNNLAEYINSILALVGLTGIGAITLTLHHARAARRHHLEANTDALTGVLNRRALFQRFRDDDVITGLAVIMFDLDHFKQINDRHGHAHGDKVLQQFADVLRSGLRHSDIIARLGGEEFCAILPGRDWETARAAAERVRKAFAELQLPIGEVAEIATVSAGMATGGINEPFSSVLSRADAALYKAKEAGRNQVHAAPIRLVA
ncbi:GGDEF domain-containing protein [Devosia sp. XJ19-1]|uniref:diguanylate cyclase n=1 Tax=Devosia ureilytica TaxID=2952754 RepID=A0A9Q4FSK2_9HYPH|nr:GGDEF domain-containing protein [Devosia ureilytica]MCP8883799.1 GGDEF domain-containing protein [Devosia ureilytica]MCP8887407.1 GGDEF domain-containing protein [Devosia ureilytica]